MNNTNNFSARASFEIAKAMLINAFRANFKSEADLMNFVNGLKLSQSEIRLEVGLIATSTQFNFGVNVNQQSSSGVQFATEQRLNMQDSLVVSEYGIFVAKTTGAQDDNTFRLRTYGNPVDFSAAAALALDSAFYDNGNYQLRCNNDVIMPYRGMFNHHYLPETQQTAPAGAGSPNDQIRGAEDGMITAEPNIVLIGSKNYQPSINLTKNMATVDAGSRAILIYRGILAQNSTVVS